ncbi:hypothetical protein P691DRAFT_325890 [Macrolepiota fuliginosa MF-IS2]|uniref:FHA domain-containing protein n=1 Tax=Macrolepiota fuliginosa MF-IS2 TaxID=1400762 RepID=A0A9P5X7P8_9AGAR|nr:hypothetical protein P691DRAFT_325890 [Macrolepiota fuliginosa MF-IS2]
MAPTPPPPQGFPALYLYPLNDSFVPKHISLVAGQRVKIGRQTNPKTAPGEKNGFFDSKVLSRQHAEVWEDGGKIYIKDVKSSNGTFINGERLSAEGVESDPYELKSDDIVEFGIDIVGEDNKTIIHHKVAARAVCVFSEQDAQVAARAEQHQQQQQQQQHLLQHQQHQQQQYAQHSLMGAAQPGGPNGIPSQFNFVGGPQQRRPGPNVGQGIAGIGGMGGSMRPPGKSGLTFEHILNRLQGELQKSRETGSELHSLSGSISDIHQVLGGNIPSGVPPYNPPSLPPARPHRQASPSQIQPASESTSPPPSDLVSSSQQASQPQQPQPQNEQSQPPPSSPPTVLTQLQSQLRDAQLSLAEHADKVRALEVGLADHDHIRKEVMDLKQLFETRSREILFEREHDHEQEQEQEQEQEREDGRMEPRGGFDHEEEEEDEEDGDVVDDDDIRHIRMLDEVDDDDDVRSVATVRELERGEGDGSRGGEGTAGGVEEAGRSERGETAHARTVFWSSRKRRREEGGTTECGHCDIACYGEFTKDEVWDPIGA